MLKEVIIVEGKMDTLAVKKALSADTIETGGFTLNQRTLNDIGVAYTKRGIIILTDPDSAGERIRRFLTQKFPDAGQAFIPKVDATANNDIGVEQASAQAIRTALAKVRHHEINPQNLFTMQDLLQNQLNGNLQSTHNRAKVGAILGIGYANAKKFLERLNHYGITKEEFNHACDCLTASNTAHTGKI